MMISIENEDDESVADKAIVDVKKLMKQFKRKTNHIHLHI